MRATTTVLLFAALTESTAFGIASLQTLQRAVPAAAVADGVTDSVGFLRMPAAATCPAVMQRQRAPLCVLGLGKKKAAAAEENEVPPLETHPSRKVALLVEPTPFTHVSGYSNRFKEMLRFLKQGGDDAEVITPDDSSNRPDNFLGMPITYVPGFRLIFYKQVQLTLDIGLSAFNRLRKSRPNLIHAVTPGFFVIPAILYARLLKIPLVISYHTHLPTYADRYVKIPGLRFLAVKLAEWCAHTRAPPRHGPVPTHTPATPPPCTLLPLHRLLPPHLTPSFLCGVSLTRRLRVA